jgi:hypothetical protein
MKKRWGLKTLKVEEKQLRVITYSAWVRETTREIIHTKCKEPGHEKTCTSVGNGWRMTCQSARRGGAWRRVWVLVTISEWLSSTQRKRSGTWKRVWAWEPLGNVCEQCAWKNIAV